MVLPTRRGDRRSRGSVTALAEDCVAQIGDPNRISGASSEPIHQRRNFGPPQRDLELSPHLEVPSARKGRGERAGASHITGESHRQCPNPSNLSKLPGTALHAYRR